MAQARRSADRGSSGSGASRSFGIRFRSDRSVWNGSSLSPSLTTPRNNAASISSRRSAAGSARKLRSRLIPDLDELPRRQIREQRDQIALAALGIHVELFQNRFANFVHGSWL